MRNHYERVITFCCFLFVLINVGFPSTSFNVYQPYVVELVGDTAGSMILAARTLVSMVAVMFVDRWYSLLNCRVGIFLGTLCTMAGFIVYGFAHSFVMFLVGAMISGLGYALGGMVGATLLTNRWYRSGIGNALGINAVGSGVAGIVVPLLAVPVIHDVSLSAAFFGEAAFAGCGALVILALLRNYPADMGLEPYSDEGENVANPRPSHHTGMGASLTKTERFLLVMAMLFVGVVAVGSPAYISVLYNGEGFNPHFVAMLLSFVGVSLTAGKYLSGRLMDTLGTYRSSRILFGFSIIGLLTCCMAPLGLKALALLSVVFYGFGLTLGSVGISIWSIEMADPKNYARSVKNFQVAYSAGGFVANLFPGVLCDIFGTYVVSYGIFLVLAVAASVIVLSTYVRHRSVPA
ncbi:MFS transporter [Slackia heliotrinireducens]|uniref:MFS transporter n=1 Tax=Slackia heliotrinireducens TaxID=84110 RepID=UPI003315026D